VSRRRDPRGRSPRHCAGNPAMRHHQPTSAWRWLLGTLDSGFLMASMYKILFAYTPRLTTLELSSRSHWRSPSRAALTGTLPEVARPGSGKAPVQVQSGVIVILASCEMRYTYN